MMRTRFRRSGSMRRRARPHYQWARASYPTVTGAIGAGGVQLDLLSKWKLANGFTLNLPDIVIWRVHLKISIHYTLSPATVLSGDGLQIAVFCDSVTSGAGVTPLSQPYDESYMMWDKIYAADTLANGANVQSENATLYKEYDIRSHRKLTNQADTLILSMVPIPNLTIGATDSYDVLASILLKLPGRG